MEAGSLWQLVLDALRESRGLPRGNGPRNQNPLAVPWKRGHFVGRQRRERCRVFVVRGWVGADLGHFRGGERMPTTQTKEQLYREAKRLGIKGRSKMKRVRSRRRSSAVGATEFEC